eukprot:UN15720
MKEISDEMSTVSRPQYNDDVFARENEQIEEHCHSEAHTMIPYGRPRNLSWEVSSRISKFKKQNIYLCTEITEQNILLIIIQYDR